jgi:signal peptidase II
MKNRIVALFALLFIAGVVVALDQATKAWITANIVSHEVRPIIEGFVRLRYTQNTGAAFGFFQDSTAALSFAAIIVLGAILLVALRVGNGNRLLIGALGLVSGGAVGNLIDRLRLGYVVDFVDVYGPSITIDNRAYTFPVFNMADSAITIGVILLMLVFLFEKPAEERAPVKPPPAASHDPSRYISRSHSPWFSQYDKHRGN